MSNQITGLSSVKTRITGTGVSISPPSTTPETTASVLAKLAGNTPVADKIGKEFILSDHTKANLSGGNILSGTQENSGAVFSSAVLGTDQTQLVNQAQAISRQNSAGIAYVSSTFGDDSQAVIGAPMRPFATVTAAYASAATQIVILENTSFGGFAGSKNLNIILTNGATLTCSMQVQIGNNIISITGEGSFVLIAVALYDLTQSTSVNINISGDITISSTGRRLILAIFANTLYLKCRRFFSNASGAAIVSDAGAAIVSYNFKDARVFIGSGTKFVGTGLPLFGIGGPTGNPKIVFGESCMIWHTGSSIFGYAGSEGGIYAPNLLIGGTATFEGGSGVAITGSVTAPAWLTEASLII